MAWRKIDHGLKILKIIGCSSINAVANRLRSVNIEGKTKLFVLVICLEKLETVSHSKLERFVRLFKDERPVILQLNFSNKKKLFVKNYMDTKFISLSAKKAALNLDIQTLKEILENLGTSVGDFLSLKLSKIPKASKFSEQIIKSVLCIRVLNLFKGGLRRIIPWLARSHVRFCELEVFLSIIDYPFDPAVAAELAWHGKSIDILEKLIVYDCRFPEGFNLNRTGDYHDVIKNIIKDVDAFHFSIAVGDTRIVSRFSKSKYCVLKCAYDQTNSSAMATALNDFNIITYELLLEKNLKFCEKCPKLMRNLPENTRFDISDLNMELVRPLMDLPNKHQLYSKCHLATGHFHQQFYSEKINEFLWELQKHPEVTPLLRIAQKCLSLKIVFDFQHSNLNILRPDFEKPLAGLCTETGNICIAAKQSDKKVCAVLAHEIAHLAMLLLYSNEFQPFQSSDEERKKEFQEIIEECKIYYGRKKIIKVSSIRLINYVFQSYLEAMIGPELIARVPQILIGSSRKDIKAAEVKYPKLFSYYRKYLAVDIDAAFSETTTSSKGL